MTDKLEIKEAVDLREEIIHKLEKIKREINDMELAVKEDVKSLDLQDEDMFRINEKMKTLEKQILNVIEG